MVIAVQLSRFLRSSVDSKYTHVIRSLATSAATGAAPSSQFTSEMLTGDHHGIRVFRMNKPETKNAISRAMLDSLTMAVQQAKYDNETRVVIIKSDVPGAFCTGADLKERVKMTPEEVPIFVDRARALMNDLENLPQPVIAALDGFALGGGLEMALGCDLRVASEDAKIGLTETKLAIIPGAGGTARLPRLIGAAAAKQLIFTGRMVDGKTAHKLGIVGDVVPQNAEKNAAYVKAVEIAAAMLECGPIAIRMAKQAINRGMQTDITTAMEIEKLCYAQVIPTSDRLEALKAFREKRKPKFIGA